MLKNYFNTFLEYLTKLNLNQLDTYFKQLDSYDYVNNKVQILEYFYFLKQDVGHFIKILRSFVQ